MMNQEHRLAVFKMSRRTPSPIFANDSGRFVRLRRSLGFEVPRRVEPVFSRRRRRPLERREGGNNEEKEQKARKEFKVIEGTRTRAFNKTRINRLRIGLVTGGNPDGLVPHWALTGSTSL